MKTERWKVKSRLIILFILFSSSVSYTALAQQATIREQSELENVIDSIQPRITSSRDTLCINDSILVIHTVCAPICSSCVRVYNNEWKEIGRLKAPFKTAFPEAYIEDGKILWKDNDPLDYTPQL